MRQLNSHNPPAAVTRWTPADDARLATASVDRAFLTEAANEDGEEGFATVTVVATDETGQTATLRFTVEVFPTPPANWRGWRRDPNPGGTALRRLLRHLNVVKTADHALARDGSS